MSSQKITEKFLELDQMRACEEHTKTSMPFFYNLIYNQLARGSNNREFLAAGAQPMNLWNDSSDDDMVLQLERDQGPESFSDINSTGDDEEARHDDDTSYVDEENLQVSQQNRANLVRLEVLF